MRGTVLMASDPAPRFELQDQFGRPVALADYDGRVVALTFLYTSCRDVCPVVTGHLKQTHEMLGDDVGRVGFVVVSVDPDRDNVQQAYAYSQQWNMLQKWAFLVGGQQELEPIWADYYVDPTIDARSHGEVGEDTAHATGPRRGRDGALPDATASKYEISHSAPVYLIDRRGLLRVLFTPPLDPVDIAHDIKLLLQ